MVAPSVSIILPVLNEGAHIEDTMTDLLGQIYDGAIEIVVADGGSGDGTREILDRIAAREERVRVIDNPKRRQSYGLNDAAAVATGEILVRVDGHSRYAANYVARSVEALAELGGAVGGRMNPVGYDRFSTAVATAMESPLTMGPGRFHHATGLEQVDTVYLGSFARADFLALGGIRAFPSGSSEDADFYYRWRQSGRTVHVEPEIVSTYAPRNTVSRLWKQYWNYGRGKSEMLWVNGRFPSWRPLAPMLLVIALVSGALLGALTGRWWPLSALLLLWVVILLVAALPRGGPFLLTMLAALVMHTSYGVGGLWGLVRGPGRLRHLR